MGQQRHASGELIATISLVAVTAIWGGTFVVVQRAIDTMEVNDFLFWRFTLGAGILFALRPRTVLSMQRLDVKRGAYIGLVLGLGYVLQTVGLQYTSATVSGFVTGMFVVFTPLVAGFVSRERVPGAAWAGVLVATVGLGLLSLNGWAFGYGEALTLGCAALFALQIVGLSTWSTKENAYGLATIQLAVVALVALVGTLPSGGPQLPPDAYSWGAVISMGVFATALAFVVQSWAQAHMSSTRAAIVLTMEPVFAGIFGVLFADDELTTRMLLGALLILAAMYLVELGPRRSREGELPHLEP
jgi:drug/metabolite transporter (DMT)-like permease